MKFLRAVRLDTSDDEVYLATATAGEPVVTGSFLWEFSDTDPALFKGRRLNAFRSGFFGCDSFGHCTLACVADISDSQYKRVIERLAQYFVEHYGAPGLAAALPRARAEAEYTASLCDRDPAHLIAVEREARAAGISESYRSIDPGQRWQSGDTPVFRIIAEDAVDLERDR